MNCAVHPDVQAVAYCRSCGKPLCESCKRVWQDAIYCEEHGAASPGGTASHVAAPNPEYSPYTAPYPPPSPGAAGIADPSASPGLAFLLGLIPGVGAIYNGQYVKGLIHVVVLGLLISIVGSDAAGGLEPVFGMLIGVW
ncbi:MAG: B-box zinc finger protein, partial [Bryobacteraceae bacterium]